MSFHKAISDSLFDQQPDTKVALLAGLHERGALDLDVVDDEGLTLMGRMSQRKPLPLEIITFLDRIGRSDVYATSLNGTFPLMDRQLWWVENNNTDNASTDAALSRMIDRVDPAWWQGLDRAGDDPGSSAVYRLGRRSHAEQSLRSLWERGVATDARLGGDMRPMAACAMTKPEMLQMYIQVGADLNLPATLPEERSVAMWRPMLMARDDIKSVVQLAAGQGLIDAHEAEHDLYLKEIRLQRGNKAEMIKQLLGRDDWQDVRTPDGTPAWLYAVGQRANILEELLARKRKRADFTQRDSEGRSAWFWAAAKDGLGNNGNELRAQMENTIPGRQFMPDLQGRGLITQLAEHCLARVKTPQTLGEILAWSADYPAHTLFAGLEEVDFSGVLAGASAPSSTDRHRGMFGLHLLAHPQARQHLTPTQRGYILGALLLGDGSLGSSQHIWLRLLEKEQNQLFEGGVAWPRPDPRRIAEREKSGLNVGSPLRQLSQALRRQWQGEWEQQQIAKHTVAAGGMRAKARL